jgi:hypothetical protein
MCDCSQRCVMSRTSFHSRLTLSSVCVFCGAGEISRRRRIYRVFDANVSQERGSGEGQSNVVSFQSHCGAEATILVSKNSGRYRVQGGSMEATWLLGSELAKRLTVHFQSSEGEPFELSCQDEMPLEEYFAVVEEHFAVRKALRATHDELAQQSALYRHTQKRLLVRYKDRNPAPLDGEQSRAPCDH